MAKIFISYRRADSQHAVDRLYDALRKRLGKKDIFIDVDNIPKGVDFVDHLSARVGECETLLAVIGPQWLSLADDAGQPRIHDPDDFVRIEIASALKRNIPVVPVLLDGTAMPSADALPDDLKPFARRNAAFLRRESFRTDAAELVDDVAPRRKVGAPLAAFAALVIAAAGLGWGFSSGAIRWPEMPQEAPAATPSPDPSTVIPAGDSQTGTHSSTQADPGSAGHVPPGADRAGGNVGPGLPSESGMTGEELAAERVKADDNAWAIAQAASTLAAYKDYLSNEAHTRHRSQAQAAVNRHEAAVMRLQTALNAKSFKAGKADGVAGSDTRRAVQDFRAAVSYRVESIDLAAIDAAPINAFAAVVETWVKPTPTPVARPTPAPQPTPTADPYPVGKVFTDCSGCPEMVVLPTGSFQMGSNDGDDDEKPIHSVSIGYQLAVGKFEVTWAQWEACVAEGGCESNLSKKSNWGENGDAGWGKGSRPVINVSWDDAQAYARWLSDKTGQTYRLLSEAEWEYAARAGTTTTHSFGDTISTSQANHNRAVGKTTPAGQYPANAFGLHDMHGNVWEWTQDCSNRSYAGAPANGSAWESGDCSRRVLRGGSWYISPSRLRSASRGGSTSTSRSIHSGFRLARTLPR